MRRLNALVIVFLLAFGLLIQGALPALGCSCALPNPYSGLADADGAFVGTLVDVDTVVGPVFDGGSLIDYYFEVEASLKGDIGKGVAVKSAADGAACGIEVPIGTRAGFLLYRVGGEWEGSLCGTLDADALLQAAEGLPEPVAGSPPHLIVVADMGTAGLLALDRQGQIVGYGEGPFPWLVSACPDDETFVGATSENTIKVWSYTGLEVIDQTGLDSTGGAWLNGLLCVGASGDPTLAIKVMSGVEQSSLVLYSGGDSEVLAEDVERLLDTVAGPVVIGSDGVIDSIDVDDRALTPLTESVGDLRGQLVAAIPSPDGTHIALSTLDWDQYPLDGRVIVVDLEKGTNAQLGVACDIYPIWLDDETLTFTDHCTSGVPGFYDTNLEAVAGSPIPDYAHTSYVTDETGTIFYPSEFAIRALEPELEDSFELTRLFTYPGALLVVPPSARTEWVQPAFVPTAIVDVPPVTFVEAPAPGVPGADPVDAETPNWLLILGAVAAGGGLWLLLRRPSGPQTSHISHETL